MTEELLPPPDQAYPPRKVAGGHIPPKPDEAFRQFEVQVEAPAAQAAEHVPGHDGAALEAFRETLDPAHEAADAAEARAVDPGFDHRDTGQQALVETVVDEGGAALELAGVEPPPTKPRRRWTGVMEDEPAGHRTDFGAEAAISLQGAGRGVTEPGRPDVTDGVRGLDWDLAPAVDAGDRSGSEPQPVEPVMTSSLVKEYINIHDAVKTEEAKTLHSLLAMNLDDAAIVEVFERFSPDMLTEAARQHIAGVDRIVARIAQMPDVQNDRPTMWLREQALRMTELGSGTNALTWRDKIKRGETVPDVAQRFVEMGDLAQMVFRNAGDDYRRAAQVATSPEAMEAAVDRYRRALQASVVYVTSSIERSTEDRNRLAGLASECFNGDVQSFGYNEKAYGDTSVRVLNGKFTTFANRYIQNIEKLQGSALDLNAEFGIVNFGRYSTKTLENMLDARHRYSWPNDDRTIMITGKTGDHNGAQMNLQDQDLENTLIFEVETADDVRACSEAIKRYGDQFARLTLRAHGGRDGLWLSKSTLVTGNTDYLKESAIGALIAGHSFKELVLHSCSQGQKYAGSGGSLAQRLSKIGSPDMRTIAAPGILYSGGVDQSGMMAVEVTNPGTVKTEAVLKHFGRVPGARKLLSMLQERTGRMVVIQRGKTKIDTTGRMRIGS